MQIIRKILDKATDELSECLKNEAMLRLFPEVKEHIDYTQEILLNLMIDLEDMDRMLLIKNLTIIDLE